MSGRAKKMLQEYRQLVMERECLENQIQNFKGITETEMIEAMQYCQPGGERVQTGSVSDKTAKISIAYKAKMERINQDWQAHLVNKHEALTVELQFFEAVVLALSGILPEFISDLVIKGISWDGLAIKYHISRTMVAKYRKKAIRELDVLYAIHDKEIADYMLR